MKKILIFIFMSLGGNGGCVSSESTYTLGGAALGGLSGVLASAKNPKMAPLAAGAGAALGGMLGNIAARTVKSGRYAAFKEGYEQGASDTVKRQYWILQNLQKKQTQESKWASYTVPIAASQNIPSSLHGQITLHILK